MKRSLVVFMAALFVVGFVSAVVAQEWDVAKFDKEFAAAKIMTAEGDVVSHDVKCHCVIIKTANGTMTFQDDYADFNQDYNRAKGLKIGPKAKITYKTVSYINYATKIAQ
jgi:hypothetical protein